MEALHPIPTVAWTLTAKRETEGWHRNSGITKRYTGAGYVLGFSTSFALSTVLVCAWSLALARPVILVVGRRRCVQGGKDVSSEKPRHVLIVGGGVARPALALFLKKAGMSCAVYESHSYTKGVGGGLALPPTA